MRTTIDLDTDVLDAARNLSRQERISLGRAVSKLARRGLHGPSMARNEDAEDTAVFTVSEDTPVFGTEDVKRALDEE